jgi:hypothetical protein
LRIVSAKRRKLAPARKRCREAVIERSGGRCEAKFSMFCLGFGTQLHEKLTRARGGSITKPANALWVCTYCHFEIHHSRPADATAAGLLISQHANAKGDM